MSDRILPADLQPAIFRRLLSLHKEVEHAAKAAGVDQRVIELVKVRASQLNGCAYCTDLHTREALSAGVTPRQLTVLPVWRETKLFTPAERAALALSESMTKLPMYQQVPDEVYDDAIAQFSDEQLAVVIWAVSVMQAFNTYNVTCPKPLPDDAGEPT